MECKKCGAMLPKDGKFCPMCGARADGKKICPSCRQSVAEEAVYCTYCGKRLDGKNVCAACGTAYAGNFCPQCGAAESSRPAVPVCAAPARSAVKPSNWRRVVDIVKSSVFLGGVFILFVCCFFIGIGGTVSATGADLTEIGVRTTASAFDYLITQFKDFSDTVSQMQAAGIGVYTEFYVGSLSAMIVEAVAVLANMIIIITCFVIAVVKFAKNIGRREVALGKYFALAAGSFLCTTIFLAAATAGINDLLQAMIGGIDGIRAHIGMNAACIAGLVFLSLAAAAGLVCHIVVNAGTFFRRNLFTLIFGSVLVLIVGVALILIAGKSVGDSIQPGNTIYLNIRIFMQIMFMQAGVEEKLTAENVQLLTKIYTAFWLNIITVALLSAFLMAFLYRAAQGKAPRVFSLAATSVGFVLSIFYAVFLYVTADAIGAVTQSSILVSAGPVAGAVLLLFALGAAIAYLILREKKTEAPVPPVSPVPETGPEQ